MNSSIHNYINEPASSMPDTEDTQSLANQLHRQGKRTELGRLLRRTKKQLGHGNWEDWLKDLEFSPMTAKRLMKAALGGDPCSKSTKSSREGYSENQLPGRSDHKLPNALCTVKSTIPRQSVETKKYDSAWALRGWLST